MMGLKQQGELLEKILIHPGHGDRKRFNKAKIEKASVSFFWERPTERRPGAEPGAGVVCPFLPWERLRILRDPPGGAIECHWGER